jgi:hypothetical protein
MVENPAEVEKTHESKEEEPKQSLERARAVAYTNSHQDVWEGTSLRIYYQDYGVLGECICSTEKDIDLRRKIISK